MLAAAALLQSCASTGPDGSIDDFKEDIVRHESVLALNPNNPDANRDLGVIYYRVADYAKARSYLHSSLGLNQRDAKARFFYGMTLEALNDTLGALNTYLSYVDYSEKSPYRKLMEGRFRAVRRDIISSQLRDVVAAENRLTDADADSSVVAVYPLRYAGADERYATLGFGLAELLITDLGQVQGIRLVERIRMNELLDEIRLQQSTGFDPATTVRVGRLLKAGNLVSGSFDVSPEDDLRTDVTYRKTIDASAGEPIVRTEDLDKFFVLEKQLVFDVLARLGVEPTPVEKERIDRVPTRNVQAFILYCIGLERESVRDFIGARSFHDRAVSVDPGFTLARERRDAMDALILAGTRDDALANARILDPEAAVLRDNDIVLSRINTLLTNAGYDPYPGTGSRTAPADAFRETAPVLPLTGPPNPPR